MASTACRCGPKDPTGAHWQSAAGRLTAARTSQAAEPIFVDDRPIPGKFSDLMDQGFRVVARKLMTASAASGLLTMDRLMNTFRRDQRTVGFALSRLPVPILPVERSRGSALHSDRISGRGLRRVGGVQLVTYPQIADARFKFGETPFVELHECDYRRLDLRRSRIPQRLWARGRPFHARRTITSIANDNPRL
jgi:hypothetical protein